MTITRIHRTAYHFHGITVIVPDQINGTALVAIDKGSLVPDRLPYKTDVIKEYPVAIRLIANIALLTRQDYENGRINPVTEFNPPIELRVNYNYHDVLSSGGDVQNLKLAFWDGSQWAVFREDLHQYLVLPPSTGQVAEAKVGMWPGDPPIAWVT